MNIPGLSAPRLRAESSRVSASSPQPSGDSPSSSKTAYTLTACTRCRERKSRCDPALPRCTPCERSGSHCEYWDVVKRRKLSRNYIIQLQENLAKLEEDLARLNIQHDIEDDQEDLVRDAAVVTFKETAEKKYLGPSSGTTMTRLVMRLAKDVMGAESIRDIITPDELRQVDDLATQEEGKATSKIDPESYPLVSSYAARELPGRELAMLLLQLYNIKVQTMYPVFLSSSLLELFNEVYDDGGTDDPYKSFVVRMIIAIGLQRLDTKYAGAADSYYLGALTYFEALVRKSSLETLKSFVLIGQYSLLTPTRTAVYYVVGMGVRLAQVLGITEERTLAMNEDGTPASPLDIDLKRRVFWAIITMDYGLSHSLGRPAMMSTAQENFDVKWFALVEDEYIQPQGILDGPFSIRKFLSIHFYSMRLLQLEIRRNLYMRRCITPADDSDPWFKNMEKKMIEWRDASPNDDQGSGFSERWFKARYYIMLVFLFRPSPQVPRPSIRAATLCYEACEFTIHEQRAQIANRSVEVTWIFTQAIFMAVNTMLWSISYAEVRREHSHREVRRHMDVALEAMAHASERWPGVESAIALYERLITACLQIFDKKGDIQVHHPSPSAAADEVFSNGDLFSESSNRSATGSPTPALTTTDTPAEPTATPPANFYSWQPATPPLNANAACFPTYLSAPAPSSAPTSAPRPQSMNFDYLSPFKLAPAPQFRSVAANIEFSQSQAYPSGIIPTGNPKPQFSDLPSTFAEMGSWNFSPPATGFSPSDAGYYQQLSAYATDRWLDYEDDDVWTNMQGRSDGLNQAQQNQLMQRLETEEIERIETLIRRTNEGLLGHTRMVA